MGGKEIAWVEPLGEVEMKRVLLSFNDINRVVNLHITSVQDLKKEICNQFNQPVDNSRIEYFDEQFEVYCEVTDVQQFPARNCKLRLVVTTPVHVVQKFSWVDDIHVSMVEVMGSWDGWKNKFNLLKRDNEWSNFVTLTPGMYEYRFLVNNQWRTSKYFPISSSSPENNSLIVTVPVLLDFPAYMFHPNLKRIHIDTSLLSFQEKTDSLLVAVDCVSQLLVDPLILRHYAWQDRKDMTNKDLITETEVQQVFEHFQNNVPRLCVAENLGQNFGKTNAFEIQPIIHLQRNLVVHSCHQGNYRFIRGFILLVITLLHELSHWKVRMEQKRNTPEKEESGHITEIQIFKGKIIPSIAWSEQCDFLNTPLTFRTLDNKFLNDMWIERLCRKVMAGMQITAQDIEIAETDLFKAKKMEYHNQQVKEWRLCSIESERNNI
eukprot:TRINITY_DN23148_c0_g1_i1.p1 TRINITY_DN23148_c0_g1~~TRINITY_DN23148_c0_g1_i1.p1  ORF type:complete len:434 (+),score=97.72 TRINITY_DN23148_c0_g1_i1:99-1400(+)